LGLESVGLTYGFHRFTNFFDGQKAQCLFPFYTCTIFVVHVQFKMVAVELLNMSLMSMSTELFGIYTECSSKEEI
jgi:hypothetical protein